MHGGAWRSWVHGGGGGRGGKSKSAELVFVRFEVEVEKVVVRESNPGLSLAHLYSTTRPEMLN